MKYKRLTISEIRLDDDRRAKEFSICGVTIYDLYNRLAELEDKIENGTLIELPCKVGDTVYCIYRDDEYEYWIEEALVHDFIYTNYGEIDIGTECRMLGKVYRYCVCLTKAEAEKKLKELKGNNMESEKVKEIKKGLEVCSGLCTEACPYHSLGCINDLSKNSLTLINELESKLEAKESYYNAVKNRALEVFVNRIKGYIHSCENISNSADEDLCERIDETLKELQGK